MLSKTFRKIFVSFKCLACYDLNYFSPLIHRNSFHMDTIQTVNKVARDPQLYIQTKIEFCKQRPFIGLEKLAMWYSFCLIEELNNWETAWKVAKMGERVSEKAILSLHPKGFTFRRILTDGRLFQVFEDNGKLCEESLLPISVLGKNAITMEISDVPNFVLKNGGFRARFLISTKSYTGYLLPGKCYWGAWDEALQRGLFFEAEGSRNPNGKVLERL